MPAAVPDRRTGRTGRCERPDAAGRRSARYGKEEWQAIRAEAERLEAELAAALQAGLPPNGEAAMALAESHRQHISRWFYECTYEVHRGLAALYESDPRFAQHYEQVAPGLAAYVSAALRANADRAERAS